MELRAVQRRFNEEYMVLHGSWLDIEYSQDRKYIIGDKKPFPDR